MSRRRRTPEEPSGLRPALEGAAAGLVLAGADDRNRALFAAMREGVAYCRMIFDQGRPVDWVYLDVNPAFYELTGLRDVVGRRVSEVIPDLYAQNPELFALYGKVVETGVSERLEVLVRPLGIWLAISVIRPEEGCFVVLFEDISQRMLAERQLRESLDRYSAMMNTAADAMFVNCEDRIILVNPQALRLFGAKEKSQLLGRSPLELTHSSGREATRERIAQLLESGEPAPLTEQRMIRLDGSVVEVEVAAVPFQDNGRPAIHVTLRDISERKRAEAQLRHHEAMLREAGEIAHVGGWEFDPATGEGSWTAEVARIHDLDPGQLTSKALGLSSYGGESRTRIEAAVKAAVERGEPYDLELEMTTATGARKWVRSIANPELVDGKVVRVRGSLQDITARVATDRALAEERARLRTVLDTIPDLIWVKDPDGAFLACNAAFARSVGRTEAEIVGSSDADLYPREVAESFRRHDLEAMASASPSINEERIPLRESGTDALFETVKTRVLGADGRLLGVLGIARDVTRARAVAESLRESEAHYRALAETTFDWIWEVDAEGRYTFVSPRVRELLGYAPEEVLGRTPFSLMPPEEAERVGALYRDYVERRAPFAELVNVNRHKDGRLVVLESSGVPYFGPDGEFLGHRGMDRDITARKQAERRLATQAAVSRVLATSLSLAEAAPGILQAIGESEGWKFGAVWQRDRASALLSCVAWWADGRLAASELGARTMRMRLACGEGFPGRVWADGRPRSVAHLPADATYLRQGEASALGLLGAVGFPIRLGDEVVGVIEFLGSRMDDPDPVLKEAFEAIGNQIGLFVERRRTEATVRRFVSGSPAVIYALRVEPAGQRLIWVSDNLEQLTGWKAIPEDGSKWWMENLHPEHLAAVQKSFMVPYELEHQVIEFRFRRPDGSYIWVRDERRLVRDDDGQAAEIIGSWTDVTERVELEEKLRVAQKLEAIGRLAGGVAHDFNNMLMVISGNGEMLDRALSPDGPERALLGEIREAAERSASLTRQLLAFSRTQVLAPRVVRLDAVVADVESMLRRLIGEDIALVCELDRASGQVLVDRSQLEQVIVNLAVNARDAMPRGGSLTVATSAIELDERACRGFGGVAPGTFARLEVRDTGTGMSPQVLERIFEPFFTTKPQGSGTGLGLSTAFGFVKQSGGHIEARSTEGEGSTFVIYLPQVAAAEAPPPAVAESAAATRGGETILLVEDEAGVRRVVRLALEKKGYRMIVASSGREAIELAQQHPGSIDLLLTDLVMPEMSGRELAEVLRARQPGLAVLLMSGYVEDDFVRLGVETEKVAFLHKPFTLMELAAKARETLDAARP